MNIADFNIADFNPTQLLAIGAAAGFLVGWIFARLISGSKQPAKAEDPRNHVIRELEADLRMSSRRNDEMQQALDDKQAEFDTSVETLQELRMQIADLETEAESLRQENKHSVRKMRELRVELQDRATQTVREHMRAEEAETELQVVRAGSDAVMGEISRLQEERERMSDTMRILEERVSVDGEDEVASQDSENSN